MIILKECRGVCVCRWANWRVCNLVCNYVRVFIYIHVGQFTTICKTNRSKVENICLAHV